MKPFVGAKIVLVYGNEIIAIQRDVKPGLRFSGMWDLPGGGRDKNESPVETVQREVFEELNITLNEEDIIYQKEYPAMVEKDSIAYFLAATVNKKQVDGIVFGDEGEGWKLTTINDFLKDDNVVPHLRGRLEDFIKSL